MATTSSTKPQKHSEREHTLLSASSGSFIKVYKDGKMVHQEIKSDADGMSLTDCIQCINNLIK